jgi:hypothetical protein
MRGVEAVTHRTIVIATMILVSFLLMGCGLEACVELVVEKAQKDAVKQISDKIEEVEGENAASRTWEEEPGFTLSEGEILNVRLNYGSATADESGWYRVRIDNDRSQWYDYVEWSSDAGLGGDQMNNFSDYPFGSENFNKQMTDEYYDPAHVDGTYTLSITGSTGYSHEQRLEWKDGAWVGTSGALIFNVP